MQQKKSKLKLGNTRDISVFVKILGLFRKIRLCHIILILGVAMSSYANDTEKNQRFPAKDYFTGDRFEMGNAIYQNDKNKVKTLLEEGIDVNALSKENSGFTYLMYAIFLDNRFDIAEMLLKNKANPNLVSKITFKNKSKESYYLPLAFASERLPIEYMKLLLQYGADPNNIYVSDNEKKHLHTTYPMNVVVKSLYLPSIWSRDEYISDIKDKINLLLKYGANFGTKDNVGHTVFENAEINPEILLYIMNKEKNTGLYGNRLMNMLKNSLKNSNETTKRTYEEIIKKLTAAGYN